MAVSCLIGPHKVTMKRKRILFAAVDIGDRIRTYSGYIHEKYGGKADVKSFVKFKVPGEHYDTRYDYTFQYHKYPKVIQWCISMAFFVYALIRFDVIYIFSAENILTRKLMKFELSVYRKLGKKVVMHFVGGDIRNSDYLYWKSEAICNSATNQEPALQNPFQEKVCRLAEKYANQIVVCSPDLLQFLNRKDVMYVPVFLDKDKFRRELSETNTKTANAGGKVTILHAPSNPGVKGTKYIEGVLKSLTLEDESLNVIVTTDEQYSNTVLPPYTVTRYRLLELMNESDILIDQVLIGWYGLQSVEALASGNIAVCQVDSSLSSFLYPECPILTFHNIADLEKTITEAAALVKSGVDTEKQLNWVKTYHGISRNETINQLFDKLILN